VLARFARAPRCGLRFFSASSFREQNVSRLGEPRVRDEEKEIAGEEK
jgi:hypothetical protein